MRRTRSAPSTWRGLRVLVATALSAVRVFGTLISINGALPAMSADLGVPAGTADRFLIAFMLANTAFILVFGRISDTVGRRPLYLGGIGLFTEASVVCALAPGRRMGDRHAAPAGHSGRRAR